ncbi:MAG: bis(5'-nucleosyl)-tetraphosphatase (symmetrical) YqeK [Clostridium sp.]
MKTMEEIYAYLKDCLKPSRYMHVLGVVSISKKLANLNGVSEEKAEIAALCHDIAKNLHIEELKKIIEDNQIELTYDEEASPQLWHSIVAPIEAKKKFEIEDEDILEAARWHTTGRENMSTLEKIVYIADMIEPSRTFPGVEELREATLRNLDEGVLKGLNHTINFLMSNNFPIDINTIKARNYLIINSKKS